MTEWLPHTIREAALKKMNALLAVSPDRIEARFNRACLLAELGRAEESKAAYLDVLAREPTHFGALNNLGNLLYATGFKTAARTVYLRTIEQHPDNPKGHVNLANVLAENGETKLAMKHFEIALGLDPDHVEANRGVAYLLSEMRDEERAEEYRQKAFRTRPIVVLPYTGTGKPVTLLLLGSASGGSIPLKHHIDESVYLASILFVEYYDPSTPLPAHQLIFNTIGDADLCRAALEAAMKIVQQATVPVINHPQNVMPTGRMENARRLAGLEGIITPHTLLLSRSELEKADAHEILAEKGFFFPLLLRAPGFHTGKHFVRVNTKEALLESLATMPGDNILVMEYLDAQSEDGKIRKYRVMMIGGVLYPLHLAISHEWKIHYFTAEMADNPEHRKEDEAFLNDMSKVLGVRAMKALEKIAETLALDYGGMDFSLNGNGEVLLFEANATMVVHPPDKDPRWDYRRPAVQRILDAIGRLLGKHAL